MKITPKQYATLLYEMTKGVGKDELAKTIRQFLTFLLKQHAFGQIHRILQFYKQVYNTQEKISDFEITTSRALSTETLNRIKKEMADENVEILNMTDPKLIGGAVVKIGDTLFDGSLRNKLEYLRNS